MDSIIDQFQYSFQKRQERKRTRIPLTTLKLLTIVATVFFIGVIVAVLGVSFLFAWYAKDLPRPDKIKRSDGLSTIIYDRTGMSLYDIYAGQNRIPISIDEIPKPLKQATIAVEDKDFYQHQGLSTAGIIRAVINIFAFRNFQGGSTLTQQLVKNVLLTNERNVPRKIKEAILAIQIERKYKKDEILQMYLNEAPYGGPAVGVEAAAQYFFGKHAKDLTFLESVVLAGLPQSPSQYNPFGRDPKAYIWRAEQVLRRMREDGYITDKAEKEYKDQVRRIQFGKSDIALKAPHFISYIKDLLVKRFGENMVESGGLRVTTTIDWKLQEKAETIVKEEVDKLKTLKVSNGAAVIINPKTGEILAMVGSKDYNASDSGGFKFNVVTQGLRQPGSAIKPIAYATAFQKGYTLSTLLMDVETKYPSGDPKKPEYNPKNYDGKFRGPLQLRFSLANSINSIAVKVTALVGVKDVLNTAYNMGLSTLEPTNDNLKRLGLSLALGGGEVKLLDLTQAFGVFAIGGERLDPYAIIKVTDAAGNILFEPKPSPPQRVLSKEISFLISHILSDNDARKLVFGERSYLVIPGHTVAVKTGTTDDKRDNWTIGYTQSVVVGTWVGNNDNSPMNSALASGITGAAPIWSRIIQEVLKQTKDEPLQKPESVLEMEVDAFAGGLPLEGQPKRKEFFIKGTEPTAISSVYKKVKVSKKDGNKLANPVDIAKGEYDEKTFPVFIEQDPVSTDGKNRWQEGIDAWISAQSDDRYKVPKDTYQYTDPVVVILKEPRDMSRIDNNSVHVVAEGIGEEQIAKLEIFVDGTLVKDTSNSTFSEDVNVPNGSHVIRAKATDKKGRSAERSVKIGIKEDLPTPTP